MAVTSMSRSSIGDFARGNRISGPVDASGAYAKVSTAPTTTFNDGVDDWDVWIFKSNGSLIVEKEGTLDVFVVAGGGSSGAGQAFNAHCTAGGGAGGVARFESFSHSAGTKSVVIGGGGASRASGSQTNGLPGVNSSFDGTFFVAAGGGFGGGQLANGGSGGSGGGGGGRASNAGTQSGGLPNPNPASSNFLAEFFKGSSGGLGASVGAGGGGGAGANGSNGSGNFGANGGAGAIETVISASIATAESVGVVSGSDVYFAGGGGGGGTSGAGTGGLGGGGGGKTGGNGNPGVANTGGGGGGINGGATSGAGGSGVVIVRAKK